MAERQASVYVVAGAVGPARIGVAVDPRKRLRELQVGSPVRLELALAWPCANRLDAEAVVEELYRRFAARRAHGRWYRLSAADVRSALANPATLAAPATAAAAARAARLARRRGRRSRARTEKELAYQLGRRRERVAKRRRAARLIGRGMTQTEAAGAVGVTARTLRNWKAAPGFRRELERQRERAARQRAPAADSNVEAPARQDAKQQRRDRARRPGPPAQPERDPSPAPPGQQETIAAAGERPRGGLRHVAGVPLWGDADGWPRTPHEHAERDAYYTARRDRSQADRIDYNTVVRFGGQTPAEKRAVRHERMRSRDPTRSA